MLHWAPPAHVANISETPHLAHMHLLGSQESPQALEARHPFVLMRHLQKAGGQLVKLGRRCLGCIREDSAHGLCLWDAHRTHLKRPQVPACEDHHRHPQDSINSSDTFASLCYQSGPLYQMEHFTVFSERGDGDNLRVEGPRVKRGVEEGCRFLDAVGAIAEVALPLPKSRPEAAGHIRSCAVQAAGHRHGTNSLRICAHVIALTEATQRTCLQY